MNLEWLLLLAMTMDILHLEDAQNRMEIVRLGILAQSRTLWHII